MAMPSDCAEKVKVVFASFGLHVLLMGLLYGGYGPLYAALQEVFPGDSGFLAAVFTLSTSVALFVGKQHVIEWIM